MLRVTNPEISLLICNRLPTTQLTIFFEELFSFHRFHGIYYLSNYYTIILQWAQTILVIETSIKPKHRLKYQEKYSEALGDDQDGRAVVMRWQHDVRNFAGYLIFNFIDLFAIEIA